MKKLIIASSILSAFAGNFAYAEEAAAPAPDHVFSFNVGATNDYRFRGISQTRMKPAVSAGADYSNTPTGLYAGIWTSNIEWVKDNGGGGNQEVDIYGGIKGEVSGVSYDVGMIRYYYPSNRLNSSATVAGLVSANTTEAYIQAGYGPAYIKYSQALTNFIGWGEGTDGSNYIDIGANVEIKDGYILNLHAGKQVVKNYLNGLADYTDWKVGVTKDFGLAVVALAVVGTNADKTSSGYDFGGKGYLGGTTGVVTISKAF